MSSLAGTAPLTHSATLRRLLYEALTELGHDPASIYRRANQHRRLVPPPTEGRLSHDEAPLFWQAADALCGDPDIGLHWRGDAAAPARRSRLPAAGQS